MAGPTPQGKVQEKEDYLTRFQKFQLVEQQRDALVEEIIVKLDAVTTQLNNVKKERAREVSVLEADLENEREARRGWQDKAATLREQLSGMEQARFVLLLIDADADMYLFHKDFLTRGLQGGQAAADKLVAKVREHLLSLGPSFKDAKTVPIMVKAYANLYGLAQACVRDMKLGFVEEMVQFWTGFSRSSPLVDFVDVGPGKEEADNKLRGLEVLDFHVGNPQCQQVLLACCHDAGYIPVLRKYGAQKSLSDRITLLSIGAMRPDMVNLGFQTTKIFEPLFTSSISPPVSPLGAQRQNDLDLVDTVRQNVGFIMVSSTSTLEKPVSNSGRLRPIMRNSAGKRIDKSLNVDENLVNAMKKHNLCNWHYLRANCTQSSCKRNHGYPRPLSPAKYDALWLISRQGMCYRQKKAGDCNDDQCLYGHSGS